MFAIYIHNRRDDYIHPHKTSLDVLLVIMINDDIVCLQSISIAVRVYYYTPHKPYPQSMWCIKQHVQKTSKRCFMWAYSNTPLPSWLLCGNALNAPRYINKKSVSCHNSRFSILIAVSLRLVGHTLYSLLFLLH